MKGEHAQLRVMIKRQTLKLPKIEVSQLQNAGIKINLKMYGSTYGRPEEKFRVNWGICF